MIISKRAALIAPSATLAVDSKAKEFQKRGFKVINFSVGQPDFPTPKNVKEAAKKAIDQNFTYYTAAGGIPELRQAIADKLKKENNLVYAPSQIVVSAGGKHSLYNLMFVLINEGDEVILPTPAWVSYAEQVKVCGGKVVLLQGKKDFKITAKQLEKAITLKTKLLILNSPSNPTGAVYEKDELMSLAKVIVKKKIWVISDEVYEKDIFDNLKFYSIASLGRDIFKRTLVVNAVSKTYSMTGWRVGYAAGDKQVMKACEDYQSQTTSSICSISQKAALEALSGPQKYIPKMIESFDKRRKLMVAGLKTVKGIKASLPKGAFYVFCDISQIDKDSSRFCQMLIEKEKVAAVPGAAFFSEGHIRLSYAISEADIKEGIKRIRKFIKEEYGYR